MRKGGAMRVLDVFEIYKKVNQDNLKRLDENTVMFLGRKYKKYPGHKNNSFRKFYKQTTNHDLLHRKIYEHHHKRQLRMDEFIKFVDGDLENLAIDNLKLKQSIKKKKPANHTLKQK